MNICYDESFWKEFELLMYDRNRMDETKEDVDNLFTLLKLEKGDKLLDVCCGFGRYSKLFALKGVETTGIDITKYYIDRAIESGKGVKNLDYILGDITEFKEIDKYDYAINMFTSFGLLDSEDDEIEGLKNVFNGLKPGGKYLIDTQGKELLCRDYERNIWFESGGVKVFLEYIVKDCFTVLQSKWMYYKDSVMHERTFDTRIYSAVELATMMYSVGFKEVEIFGNYSGDPYNMDSKRLVVIGTK